MTLDDVYGPEHDRFPLEQEKRAAATPPLDWGEIPPQQPAPEKTGPRRSAGPPQGLAAISA
jgi:hypothetical protein